MVDIKSFLEKEFSNFDIPIVVAVSGGPDSMALLSLLEHYFKTIICAHVNHNTGRIGQNEEEQFVKEYCKKHELMFESMKIMKYEQSNFHDEAHKIRYQYFESLLRKYHSKYLFTAHHGDDLMETMLFRMMRGSNVSALYRLSKISPKKDYFVIRPLLEYTKEDLLQYNTQNNIPYRIDASNQKEIYTRNRFRKQVIPFLKKENEKVHLKFLKLSTELKEMDEYIEKQVLIEFQNRLKGNSFSISNWDLLETIVQKRVLQKLLGHFYQGNEQLLTSHHITILRDLIASISGTTVDFPLFWRLRKEYDMLFFLKGEKAESYEFELSSDMLLPNGHMIRFLTEEKTDSNFVCRLNKEEVSFPLFVRTRTEKDVMAVKGLTGTKKIKEIFINEKVPLHERGSYPIVTDQNGTIVWLPGLKKSQFDKTKDEKYDIILKYY